MFLVKVMNFTKVIATAFCITIAAPLTAVADPSFGFGISYVFGGDVAIGVRVFSDDKPDRGALALGLDYKLRGQSWRPSVGAAYLDEDWYVDLSLGYDFGAQNIDFGAGLGLTNNVEEPATTTITGTPSPSLGPTTDAAF